MKQFTIFLLVLTMLSVACALPAVMPASVHQASPTAFITSDAPNMPLVATKATQNIITVVGTWNIRECGSVECDVIGYAYDGDTFTPLGNVRGWVRTDAGWICGAAFGEEGCE